jgi:predicted kinase
VQAIVFCGVQGAGKTSFYRYRFFETHVRVNLDMLRTRRRERILVEACIAALQPFVVDNTNPTPAERGRYLEPARAAGFKTVGYLVEVDAAVALARNAERAETQRVTVPQLVGTARRLVPPAPEEGFDELWHATAAADGWRIERLLTTPPLF